MVRLSGLAKIAFFFSLATLPLSSLAFTMVNMTDKTVNVKEETTTIGAFEATIASQATVKCKPSSHGCHGDLSFTVKDPATNASLCGWTGNVRKDGESHLYIKADTDTKFPNNGWCRIVYDPK